MTSGAITYKTIAIIPARGGSKGIPGKNLAEVGGVPLILRAIRAAQDSGVIDRVYVSTDDAEISRVAQAGGALVIERPAEIATDTASSEAALLHALGALATQGVMPTTVAFIQATSPFIDSGALREAVERVADGESEVVFSAFPTYAFLWNNSTEGAAGVNHDHSHRPRRQDREPHYQETGAFYVMNTAGFTRARSRFFGRVGIQEVPSDTAVEIDNVDELRLARLLAVPSPTAPPGVRVKALVTDFDGVHTDDLVHIDGDGNEAVVVSRSDGMGISLLRARGLPILIISKETNRVVSARADKLGVTALHPVDDKLDVLATWCAAEGIGLHEVCYVGNDINDLACMRAVGWAVAVADAHPDALDAAHTILSRPGGRGAIRELAELILANEEDFH